MSTTSICFCTVIKNRLHHLRQTLPVNLADNKEANIRFLILDYNSTDGLEAYIKTNYKEELAKGRILFYRHPTAEHFIQSHSRNMAFKLANADIICNLDADNYAGRGFGRYVTQQFESNKGIFITALNNPLGSRDVKGKICVLKSDFINVTGYDESFTGYGYEDYDLVHRLQMTGLKKQIIEHPSFLRAVPHDDTQRLKNEKAASNLHAMYIHYIDPDTTEMLLLMRSHEYEQGIIVNNHAGFTRRPSEAPEEQFKPIFKFSMVEPGWEHGQWLEREDQITLYNAAGDYTLNRNENNADTLMHEDDCFYKVTGKMMEEGILFYMQVTNREKMLKNIRLRKVLVNNRYGEGEVEKILNTSNE